MEFLLHVDAVPNFGFAVGSAVLVEGFVHQAQVIFDGSFQAAELV
jgi:hypothetical protein